MPLYNQFLFDFELTAHMTFMKLHKNIIFKPEQEENFKNTFKVGLQLIDLLLLVKLRPLFTN